MSKFMDPKALSKAQLVDFADDIQSILYLDIGPEGEFWNPEKGFTDSEVTQFVREALQKHGLGPRSAPRDWSPRKR